MKAESDCWMYKTGQFGRVESRVFKEGEDIPPGWVDTPAKLDAPKKPGRKKKPNL